MLSLAPSSFRDQFAALEIEPAQSTLTPTAQQIELALDLRLPEDFGRLCEVLDADGLGMPGVDLGRSSYADTVVILTGMLRVNDALPANLVVLGADADDVLLLRCADGEADAGTVLLVDRMELGMVAIGAAPPGSQSWSCFGDFIADALAARIAVDA